MILGVLSFVLGAYLAMVRALADQPAFAILITAGGIFQVSMQWQGYTAIRKYQQLTLQLDELSADNLLAPEGASLKANRDQALKLHVKSMIALFVMGCGAPAIVRVIGENDESILSLLVAFGLLNMLTILYGKSFASTKKRDENSRQTRGEVVAPDDRTALLLTSDALSDGDR